MLGRHFQLIAEYWIIGKKRKNSFISSDKSAFVENDTRTTWSKGTFQVSFLPFPMVNQSYYLLNCVVIFLYVSIPFFHNCIVKMNIQKARKKQLLHALTHRTTTTENFILPFPKARGLVAQLPLDEVGSTSSMLLLWDFGMLRQAGTNPPVRFIWMSLQKE